MSKNYVYMYVLDDFNMLGTSEAIFSFKDEVDVESSGDLASHYGSEFDIFVNEVYFKLKKLNPEVHYKEIIKIAEKSWMTMALSERKVQPNLEQSLLTCN